jgi:hypothetical protein
MIPTAVNFHVVSAQSSAADAHTEKVRTKVSRIGIGPRARIEAKLRDKTTLKGYISAVDHDSFTVTNVNTGNTTEVPYAEVDEVKKAGNGLSTRTWFILGGAATAAAIVGFTVIKPVVCDGGAGC